ncbi:hypothetical protein RFF05_02330 [Bengtsoniella intestinalis]|uniref:hypothetical protein n=1 Tax=Bengtsoniella intestinalis TaxID=3073143 RepID=UPI00391FB6D4
MRKFYKDLQLDPNEVFDPYLTTPSYKAANGTVAIRDGEKLVTYRQQKVGDRVYIVANQFNIGDTISVEKALENALDLMLENSDFISINQ